MGEPRREAEFEHLDELFAPLRDECVLCGKEYLRDEDHPNLLRCPECIAGDAA